MASDLYGLLAEAYSRPSRASQDLEATLGAVKSVDEGLRAYKQRQEDDRLRELRKQTLGELLGEQVPENIRRLPVSLTKDLTPVADLLKVKEPKEKESPRWQQANFQYNGNLVLFNPDPVDPFYAVVTPEGFKRLGGDQVPSQGSPSPINTVGGPKMAGSIPVGGAITPRVAPTAPAGETGKIGDLGYLKDLVRDASKYYSPKYTGFGEAVKTRWSQFSGKGASDSAAFFNRAVNDMSDALLRARSGAAINNEEYARLRKLVPSQYTSDADFMARLQAFDVALDEVIENKRSSLQQMGYRVPPSMKSLKSGMPKFNTTEEAERSGAKGLVLIGNRRAVIE